MSTTTPPMTTPSTAPATIAAPTAADLAALGLRAQAHAEDDLAEVLFGVAAMARVGELGRFRDVLRAGGFVAHGMEIAAQARRRLRLADLGDCEEGP